MPPPTRGEVAGEGGAFEASASTAPLSPASNYEVLNYRKYISWFSQNHRSILLANTKLTAASIRGEGEHFFRPIAAALHGRAAYHHDRLHEKSIIGLGQEDKRVASGASPTLKSSVRAFRNTFERNDSILGSGRK